MKYLYILFFISSNLLASTIIYTSSYIDVINESVKEDYSITIEKNLITAIDKGFIKITKGDNLIDIQCANKFGIDGHLFKEGNLLDFIKKSEKFP